MNRPSHGGLVKSYSDGEFLEKYSDDELVEKYRDGNVQAFDTLLERYGTPLYNYIYRMLGNQADAEDVLQDVFVRVIKNIGRYEMKGQFKSWVFTIANHLVVSEFRRKSKQQTVSVSQEIGADDNGLELQSVLGDEKCNPYSMLEKKELREKLDKAIQSLPFAQRQVLMMRELSGLPFKEIASTLGCPLNTVLGRMHYAFMNLRKKLAEFYS